MLKLIAALRLRRRIDYGWNPRTGVLKSELSPPAMPDDDSALKYRALTEISEAFLGSRDCDALFRGLWKSLSAQIRFDFKLLTLIDRA